MSFLPTPVSEVYNEDCMLGMARYPDKYFDLAIVDPPYGVGNFTQSDRKTKYGDYGWNSNIPTPKYFQELIRVSKRRIIWGANYYNCFGEDGGAVIWNKHNPHPSMSRCEIASLSFQKKVDYISIPHYGFVGSHDSFHPCGKPVNLYKHLIKNYAKTGDKVLDTHLGSGSSRIAAYKLGFDFYGWEIDEFYFTEQEKRFKQEIAQPLFEITPATQQKINL